MVASSVRTTASGSFKSPLPADLPDHDALAHYEPDPEAAAAAHPAADNDVRVQPSRWSLAGFLCLPRDMTGSHSSSGGCLCLPPPARSVPYNTDFRYELACMGTAHRALQPG